MNTRVTNKELINTYTTKTVVASPICPDSTETQPVHETAPPPRVNPYQQPPPETANPKENAAPPVPRVAPPWRSPKLAAVAIPRVEGTVNNDDDPQRAP